MTNRRDFLKASAAIAAVTGARAAFGQPAGVTYLPPPSSDTTIDDLALEALNAAQAAGATYADARIGRYRRQFVATREHNVTGVAVTRDEAVGRDGAVPFGYLYNGAHLISAARPGVLHVIHGHAGGTEELIGRLFAHWNKRMAHAIGRR